MGKYDKLANHLSGSGKDRLTITFREIEDILGFRLPGSARKHPAWWGNTKKGHSHAVWLDVGFRAYDVDVSNGQVTFVKGETLPVTAPSKARTPSTRSSRRTAGANARIEKLIAGFDGYIECFNRAKLFTGPSQHFHLRTMDHLGKIGLRKILADRNDPFYELLYATLTSWGMHRMGSKGAKLVDFETFRDSIMGQKERILALEGISILTLPENELERVRDDLWAILDSLKISATKAKLVANTKTLHHLLPDIIPPMDREYTLRFFYNSKMYSDDRKVFMEIYPQMHRIARRCNPNIVRTVASAPFHTGPAKVIDNAIVGYVVGEMKGRGS